MSDTKILIPASLDSYGSRADGSLRLTFSTGVVKNEQLLVINALKNNEGYLMFKNAGVSKEEQSLIESLESAPIQTKVKTQSKSKILRDKIWKYWKNNFEDKIDSEEFYEQQMDKLIAHFDKK